MSTERFPLERAREVASACSALSHPTRVIVLVALTDGAASPAQVARAIGARVAAVSHHFHALREAGLVRASGTRPNRGTIEHFYALSATGERLIGVLEPLAEAATGSARRRARD